MDRPGGPGGILPGVGLLRTEITDARGERVPLAGPALFLPWRDPERARRLHAARHEGAGPATWREIGRGLRAGVVVTPLILAAVLGPAALTFGLHLPWWALLIAAVPLGVIPAVVSTWIHRRAAPERLAAVWLAAGYCASCGYDLAQGAGPGDGPRVCPECGAAWRRPDQDPSAVTFPGGSGGGPAAAATGGPG